jgi:capsular polysaccharide transport system permease protein
MLELIRARVSARARGPAGLAPVRSSGDATVSRWTGAAQPPPRHGVAAHRSGGALLGFILVAVLPTLAFAAWQLAGAADQYAVEIRFAVRPADPARAALPAGMMAGLAAGNTDAYAVVQHLQSREAVVAAARHVDVRAILSRPEADWLARLDPAAPLEDALRAWRRHVRPYFDRSSGIVSVELRAFSAADALALAQGVEATAEAMVNAMSASSRGELLEAAEREVAAAETRFAAARAAVQAFRDRQQVVDPRRNAEAYSQHLVRLQAELIAMRAQLASLRGAMSDRAGPVMQLRSSIRATEEQIASVQARLTAAEPGATALSTSIGGFEAIETEAIFAQRAYEAAMAALERARAEARRQQIYLAPVVRPVAPERALYPARLSNTLTVLACLTLAWFVGLIAMRALKEHLS